MLKKMVGPNWNHVNIILYYIILYYIILYYVILCYIILYYIILYYIILYYIILYYIILYYIILYYIIEPGVAALPCTCLLVNYWLASLATYCYDAFRSLVVVVMRLEILQAQKSLYLIACNASFLRPL